MSRRTVTVSREEHGQALATFLQARLQLAMSRIRRLIKERQVRVGGVLCGNPGRQVRKGQRVDVELDGQKKPTPPTAKPNPPTPFPLGKGEKRRPSPLGEGLGRGSESPSPSTAESGRGQDASSTGITIRYADAHLIVVDKPAGLTTVRHASEAAEFGERAQQFLPPTLADLLPAELLRQRHIRLKRARAVHRLDRDTTGLVVFACTPAAERKLGQALRQHQVQRRYLALVRGQPKTETIESHLVRDRGDGRRGSSADNTGQHAVTHVRVREQLGDFALVECTLETGRTHQVRIHLGERGTPLCGERIYDRPLHGTPHPDTSGAERPLLHAATLELEHPETEKKMRWSVPLPADMMETLERLKADD